MIIDAETLAWMQLAAIIGQLLTVLALMAIYLVIQSKVVRPLRRRQRPLGPSIPMTPPPAWGCSSPETMEEGPPAYASLVSTLGSPRTQPRPASVHVPVGAATGAIPRGANVYQAVP